MSERIPDEALVGAFGRGDVSAFEAIVSRYQAEVAGLAHRLLGWSGEVEDVTQEVFLAAYMNLKRFRGQSSLKTWLFTITINKCRSQRRRRLVRQAFLGRFQGAHGGEQAPPGNQQESVEVVSRALQTLPTRYREPVVLYYLEELPVEQIATLLKLSPNTVHVRLNRARQRLKEKLASWK